MFDELLEKTQKVKECVCHIYSLSDGELLKFYGSIGTGWNAFNEAYGSDKVEVEAEINKRGLEIPVNESNTWATYYNDLSTDPPTEVEMKGRMLAATEQDALDQAEKLLNKEAPGGEWEVTRAKKVNPFFQHESKLNEVDTDTSKEELIEKLAALEHEQWMQWAKDILKTEEINKERAERWEKLFVPYDELTEEMKEEDRKWARKVLNLL